jgi:uncharacterized protein (TIGR03067 family)
MVLAIGLLGAADAKEDEIKKERKKMQGAWQVVTFEVDGQKEEDAKEYKVIIKDDKYEVTRQDSVISKGTMKIDPTKKPKTMDVVVAEGDNQGQTLPGIYEVDGDTQKVCLAPPEQKRPTKFASETGTGYIYVEYKKVKN